jgi:hypothetical protein
MAVLAARWTQHIRGGDRAWRTWAAPLARQHARRYVRARQLRDKDTRATSATDAPPSGVAFALDIEATLAVTAMYRAVGA